MSPFADSDIPAMIGRFGSPITIAGIAGIALVDAQDQAFNSDGQDGVTVMPVTSAIIQTSAFPNISIDDAVLLNGIDYTVRDRMRIDDGALTKVFLGTAATLYDGGGFPDAPEEEIDGVSF